MPGRCQAAVAEFEAVATALSRPVPAGEPPAGLQQRVLAAVHAGLGQAVEPAGRAEDATEARRGHIPAARAPIAETPAAEIPAAEQTWYAVEGWQIIQDPRREEAPRLEEASRLDHARPRENVVREAARRWRRRNLRRFAVTAAVAVVVAAGITLLVLALSP
jgi:hypothetical protein